MARLFLAGGSGFIGSAFVRHAIAAGHTVQALCRSERSAAAVHALGAQPVMGNLLEAGTWQAHAAQAEIVLHFAQPQTFGGRVSKARALRYESERQIMDRNLLSALMHSAVQRIVYVSGTSYYGQQDLPPKDETAKPNPRGWGPYIVKAMQQLETFCAAGLPIITVFPASVYGAGSWYAEILTSLKAGRVQLTAARRDPTLATVHVEDCARAILHLMEHGAIGERYIICDDRPPKYSEILAQSAQAMNVPLKTRAVPLWLGRLIVGPVIADLYDAHLSNARLRSTGFRFQFPTIEQGIPDVVRTWLTTHAH
ncbi:MAG: NAD(P)-dependent oxidoreductase [Anaerolineae bacterium]|nr:NAD(P)-dependent oxidoreductase [Anaerolineae bacterium]